MENVRDSRNAWIYLVEPVTAWGRTRGFALFAASHGFVYHTPHAEAAGPDFFIVNGGVDRGQTKWVAWEEGWRQPTLIIEFLSPSTEKIDRGKKMEIYARDLRCTDYFLVESDVRAIEGYRLRNGVYVPTRPNRNRQWRCGSLPLLLGFHGENVRFFDLDGTLLPTAAELLAIEQARADEVQARADEVQARADEVQARADEEKARADRESRRADEALEQLRELRRQLGLETDA